MSTVIDTTTLSYRKAEKTKPILAKPVASIVPDKSVLPLMVLKTLEGDQALKQESILCKGVEGEPWQQKPAKLLDKYKVTGIDGEGWLICTPVPGVQEDAVQVTPEMMAGSGTFKVKAQWGTEEGGVFYQTGREGDYIFRSPRNHDDIWIVRKEFFDATYTFVG